MPKIIQEIHCYIDYVQNYGVNITMFRWLACFIFMISLPCMAKVVKPGPEKYNIAVAHNFNRYLEEKEKSVHITKLNDQGLRLIGERVLNDFFSLQMQFNITGDARVNSYLSAVFDTTVLSYGFNGVFHLPVYFWNPFFKLGLHHWELSYRNPTLPQVPIFGDNLYYGFGFRFNMTPYAALFLEIERYEIKNMAINANSMGVLIRF